MFIPHNTLKPLRISVSLSFLLSLVGLWTFLTIWAGYIGSQQIDYWRISADNQLMKLKMVFFAQQVRKSQEMLENVKENDAQLRALLELKSKKAIVEDEGRGGPTPAEIHDLSLQLSGKLYDMSHQDIHRQTSALQEETKRQLASCREIMQYVDDQRTLHRAMPNCEPLVGRITSAFGFRLHPIFHRNEFHSGLDIANPLKTPVHATAFGKVHLAEWQPGYGRLIIINHGHGYQTYYGHLHKILVSPGERIQRGQVIGLVGDSGTSTGPHLHYEVQYKNNPVNPLRFMKRSLKEYTQNLPYASQQ
ncbi:MAG: hypothetical protein A2293_09575 [Elusimicrobia bacterium RIFOXYB2_FULL_49_7]|nr:MAG: hypothetical protein A2293_09575 [Elusimicrobia bacterium RIFOXYB2_FULL_49_7]